MFRRVASSILGNILEWYDFGLFAIFSVLFSHLFFPTTEPHTGLIITFMLFALGFLCRPIGALIFGYLGDKYGRAKTLRLTVLMISIPTLLIGLLPTYQTIGIFAPIILMIIRIWQGISIGGEYGGNLIYLAESAPNKQRGFITSFAGVGANLGILLAMLVGVICTEFFSDMELQLWAWRIPYLLSGILCLIIYITRLKIKETKVFTTLEKEHKLTNNPIKTVLQHNLWQVARTFGLVSFGSTFYYFVFMYLPIYLAHSRHFEMQTISRIMATSMIVMIMLVPCGGIICDYVGRRKMMLFNSSLAVLLTIPAFFILSQSNFLISCLILLLFVFLSALEQGTTSITLVENFPAQARYTGLSLGYNIGNGFLGGTVLLVCEWLLEKTGLNLAPACYIAFCALITVLTAFFFIKDTRGKKLTSTT